MCRRVYVCAYMIHVCASVCINGCDPCICLCVLHSIQGFISKDTAIIFAMGSLQLCVSVCVCCMSVYIVCEWCMCMYVVHM